MRMSAPRALRKWDRVDARPAAPAHDALIAHAHRPLAYHADLGQQEIGEADSRRTDGAANVRWNDALNETADPHRSDRDGFAHGVAVRCDAEPELERAGALA